jgi:formate dehydrogenase major subunit
MHRSTFAMGERATLACLHFLQHSELCNAEFPLLLNTGRHLYHFNAGTMTYRTPNQQLRPHDTLAMNADDARRLGLNESDSVRVSSRYGQLVLIVQISDRVKPSELFCSFHQAKNLVNRLTSSERDQHTAAPEYKRTAVRVDKVD